VLSLATVPYGGSNRSKHISCPVVVFRIESAQIIGDDLADALRDEFLEARRVIGRNT